MGNKMTIGEQINYYKELDIKDYVLNIDRFKKVLPSEMNIIFLNVNDEIKKAMIDDLDIFNLIMQIPLNKVKKSILELVSDNIRDYIINCDNLKKSLYAKKCLLQYLEKLSYDDFNEFMLKYDINLNDLGVDYQDDNLINTINISKLNNKDFNSLVQLKIKNKYELYIYAKFGVLLEVRNNDRNYIYLGNKKMDQEDIIEVDFNFLINVDGNHIKKLMEILKKKDSNCSNHMLFISVIKLYSIFGYDDTKKIIEDFFSYATDASIERASRLITKDERREYRLSNQDKFYHYGLEDEIIRALEIGDVEKFRKICLNNDTNYLHFYMNDMFRKINKNLSVEKKRMIIREIICEQIKQREKYFEELKMQKYRKIYDAKKNTHPLLGNDLYQLFKKIDVTPVINKKGQVIANQDLSKFLLGNRKKNNDCLLRMVFNNEALGLNREIYNIINNFSKIKENIDNNCNLSLNSLLDVIDISKVYLYDLKPDELDITLNTLSKILNSRKYITESLDVILSRVLDLHKKRKSRISATYPLIKGCVLDANYEVANFYDESLLTDGIDDGSCFKVGGPGEDFFDYCLNNKNGGVLHVYYNNIKYTIPFSKNGNMLNLNSIDPRINNQELFDKLIEILRKISKKWIIEKDSPIELVSITDIHMVEYMKKKKLEKLNISKSLPFGCDIYTDYNKNEVTNYILEKKTVDTKIKYECSDKLFYQERKMPYVYERYNNYDEERLDIFINSIAYASIEYLDISNEEKNKLRKNYKELKAKYYKYISGNYDWFLAVDDNDNYFYYVLPYDKRAKVELDKVLNSLAVNNNKNLRRHFN